ncbi:MAG: DUF935 family protein, partial [Sulfuriferula sp.]|nr:DUF935 family protein [Sulfuriferula sp.]
DSLPAAFAEGDTYPDQEVLDRVINAISASDMQAIAEGFIKPVIDQINKGGDAAEVLGLLAEAYPDMDESELTSKLNQLLFAAKVWGRLSAEADLE